MNLATLGQRLRASSLEQYALGVSRHAVPEPLELERLFRVARQGDEDAHRTIVDSHLRFVVDLALTRRDCGVSLSALIVAGNRGLLKAVQRYDPDGDGDFLAFAREWIRMEMTGSLQTA
jgi:DNA-directed RNA polymerase sigma subunit (sigma70/sigma32)